MNIELPQRQVKATKYRGSWRFTAGRQQTYDISWPPPESHTSQVTGKRLQINLIHGIINRRSRAASLLNSAKTMLRITHNPGSEHEVLKLEGQVVGLWVDELRRACRDVLGSNGHDVRRLVIDLSGVSFLNPDAIALFRELAERHVRVRHCSPFITEQLKGVADVDE
jgi:hypothetical protein